MGNIFDGANKIREDAKDIESLLKDLKLTEENLKKVKETFEEAEKLSEDIKKAKEDFMLIDKKILDLKENIDGLSMDIFHRVLSSWKLWALLFPMVCFGICLILITKTYIFSVRTLEEKNKFLANRQESMYLAIILEKKFWYDEKNQELYLSDKEYIKKFLQNEKKKAKK